MKQIQISEEKYNQLATDISDRLFDAHYFNQGVVNGEEIKKFAEHTQINKFLLFQIYQVWQMQISKFRHPYFSFEGEEIQNLLKQLQNELSRNIAIKQEDFKPLLKKAVYNNLKLLLTPKETLGNFFFQSQDRISLDLYERYAPFFSDFDFVVNSIDHYYRKNETTTVEKDVFFVKVDKVLELYNSKSDKDADSYRDLLFYKLTDKSTKEVIEEDLAEQRKRDEEKQKEAAKAMKLAEAQAEKERKLAEEEAEKARIAAAEKQKEEEEKAHQEAEANRLAEEARLREEAKQKAREKSFFETIAQEKTFFDLGEELAGDTGPAIADVVPEVKTHADKLREEIEETAKANTVLDRALADETGEAEAPEVEETVEEVKEVVEETSEKAKEIWEGATATTENVIDKVEEVKDDTSDLLKKKKASIFEKFASENPFAMPAATSSIADVIEEKTEAVGETVAEAAEKAADTVAEVVGEETVETKVEEVVEAVETPVEEVVETVIEKVEVSEPEPEIVEEVTTIADRFRQEAPAQNGGAVSSGEGQKIHPDEIPIHKQYQYVQKVFGGNNVRFRIIVDKINNSTNKAEVEDILNKFVLNNSEVDQGDTVVQEFTELLRARF